MHSACCRVAAIWITNLQPNFFVCHIGLQEKPARKNLAFKNLLG